MLERTPEVAKRRRKLDEAWRLALGTLGGGNHFIELCLDEADRVWLMLHSGSRTLGRGHRRAPGAGVHATLERYLDFDGENVSLQPAGHLLELALEFDGALAVGGDDARVGIGGQAGDGLSAISVNAIKELVANVAEVELT